MDKFCYKCGALEEEDEPFIDGLCKDCFLKENPLLKVPEDLSLKICKECGAYYLDNNIYDIEVSPAQEYMEAAKELVSSEIEVLEKGPTGLRHVDFEDSESADLGLIAEYTSAEDILVEIEARVTISESQVEPFIEQRKTTVKLEETRCDVCQKISTGYYEAVLQVRGQDDLSEETLSEIYKNLQEKFAKIHEQDREEFVSQIKRKHGGLNFYVSSSQLAEELGRFLKKEYGAEIDQSAELIGQTEEGEDHYRVTVVARLPF